MHVDIDSKVNLSGPALEITTHERHKFKLYVNLWPQSRQKLFCFKRYI